MNDSTDIRNVGRPRCPSCNLAGSLLYEDLKDRFFGLPGTWQMKRCIDARCGTLWLDPCPQESDLHKLYADYSTHKAIPPSPQTVPASSLLDRIRKSYLYRKYRYGHPSPSFVDKILWVMAYLHPAWKDAQAANVFYMPYVRDGLLLDLGCGSGSAMEDMRKRGWQVRGIDFDEEAVEHAKKKGLDAYAGDLFSQAFPDDSFDAVLLNHVIEHVHTPEKVFMECHRIVKPGGTVVMLTPNASSRGHAKYGKNWRGLETPHHLQLFTPRSLATLGNKVGFSKVKSFSSLQGAFYILGQSAELEKAETVDVYSPLRGKNNAYALLAKHLHWLILGWMHVLFPGRDEVAVVLCRK